MPSKIDEKDIFLSFDEKDCSHSKLFNVSGMFVPSVPYTKNTTQNMETLEPSWSLLDSRATRNITRYLITLAESLCST